METLRSTQPLHVGGLVLIPVQHVRLEHAHAHGCVWVQAFIEPRAIVVGEDGRWRAWDSDGVELPLGPLLDEVPGLADVVDPACQRRDASGRAVDENDRVSRRESSQ